MSYVGPAGIGQYSLKKGSAGILARLDIYFRQASPREMRVDFENFGEQVVGPAVKDIHEEEKEKYKDNEIFMIFGRDHYFIGPPRIIKSLFLTRVFPGEVPTDISSLVKEVDEHAETGERVIFQHYQFLHATEGKIRYLSFRKIEDYNPSKLSLYGLIKIADRKMTYYPNSNPNKPIDFTSALYK
ncbi:hypothetical protein J4214_05165 [Candidatus Woesearchaeota archaeon]|nr:hypothetical protein [Candidatus Woesearchaeota archaeon]